MTGTKHSCVVAVQLTITFLAHHNGADAVHLHRCEYLDIINMFRMSMRSI